MKWAQLIVSVIGAIVYLWLAIESKRHNCLYALVMVALLFCAGVWAHKIVQDTEDLK